ncbi:MAG: DUF5050 domain-containing protein [Lachnospiraceae bacterium]|nr:DUF5050 domain-containing protein [Lachnospiraceae bacterium]
MKKSIILALLMMALTLGMSNTVSAHEKQNNLNTDGKYMYVIAPNFETTQLVRYDSKTGETKVLYSNGEIKGIKSVIVCGDKLLIEANKYASTTYGGYAGFVSSVNYIYSMNKDGSDLKVLVKGKDMIYHKGKIYYIKPKMTKIDGEKGSLYGSVYKMNPDGTNSKLVYKNKKVTRMYTDEKYLYVEKYSSDNMNKKYYRISFKGKGAKKVDYAVYKNKKYNFYSIWEYYGIYPETEYTDHIKITNKKGELVKNIKTNFFTVCGKYIYYNKSKDKTCSIYRLDTKTLKSKKVYSYTNKKLVSDSSCSALVFTNKLGKVIYISGYCEEENGDFYDMICNCINKKGTETEISKWFVS